MSPIWATLGANWVSYIYLGLAFYVPFKTGYVNLGISAQLIGAALTLCYVGNATGSAILALGSALGISVVLGVLPAYLKVRFSTSEILTTLFLTFMAVPCGQLIMGSSGVSLEVATPAIPVGARLLSLKYGHHLSLFHCLAPVAAIVAGLYLGPSVFGYQSRVLDSNPRVFSQNERLRLFVYANLIGAVCVTLMVAGEVLVLRGRYANGYYDDEGFAGIAVGLLSFGNIKYLPVAAVFVAFIESFFLFLSVRFGVPQEGARVLYGIGILAATLHLRLRGSA